MNVTYTVGLNETSHTPDTLGSLIDGAALSAAQLDGASGPDACAAEARQGKAQAER